MRSLRTISSSLIFACALTLASCEHTWNKTAQSKPAAGPTSGSQTQAASGQTPSSDVQAQTANVDANDQAQPANAPAEPGAGSSQAAAASTPVPSNAQTAQPAQPADNTVQNQSPQVTIPGGTPVEIRLTQSLGSARSVSGQAFTATLDAPIVVGNTVVVPQGANVTGRVLYAKRSGRLKGPAELSVTLTSLQVGGQDYSIVASHRSWRGGSHKKRNLAWIGGGGGAGSLVGVAAGGGVGAAIGAGVGAGGGTVAAFVTGRKNIFLRSETRLRFVLRQPVALGENGRA